MKRCELLVLLLFLVFVSSFLGAQEQLQLTRPMSGSSSRECKVFDDIVNRLMDKYGIPGATLAIAYQGRLVHARGYGYSNIESKSIMQPTSRVRIASLSKTITSAAILKLVEEGKLSLDDNPYEILSNISPEEGAKEHDFISDVTIRDLLRHSGGQGCRGVDDAMQNPMQPRASRTICKHLGVSHPPTSKQVIRYMRTQDFAFKPGTKFAYSNYGYLLLGEVVAQITGQSYEAYVSENIMEKIGVRGMKYAQTRREERAKGEVVYYDLSTDRLYESVFEGAPKDLWHYAGWHHEGWAAAGAWLGTSVGMAKFASEFDPEGADQLLQADTIAEILKRNKYEDSGKGSKWYGLGWQVKLEKNGKHNIFHTGSTHVGAYSYLMRTNGGVVWSFHTNCRLKDSSPVHRKILIDLWRAVGSMEVWPESDFFEHYLTAEPPE